MWTAKYVETNNYHRFWKTKLERKKYQRTCTSYQKTNLQNQKLYNIQTCKLNWNISLIYSTFLISKLCKSVNHFSSRVLIEKFSHKKVSRYSHTLCWPLTADLINFVEATMLKWNKVNKYNFHILFENL